MRRDVNKTRRKGEMRGDKIETRRDKIKPNKQTKRRDKKKN